MIDATGDFDAEERKVLTESLSADEVRVAPSPEYVAELRRRLLSGAVPVQVVRGRSTRRVVLASLLGACAAAIVLVAIWFSNAEPAWASAIRMARQQAWVHAQIERDGVAKGEIWISPERDIIAAKLASVVLFFDYRNDSFLRYNVRARVAYRASQPESAHLSRELSSVSSLASTFRRSAGRPALLPNQPSEGWKLQSGMVDGVPCDKYEIEIQPPDRAPGTLQLIIDRRQSLPRSLTIVEGESHTMTSRFDYPAVGPLDERSPLLGIPSDIHPVDVDKNDELSVVARSLKSERDHFDDYMALAVTSQFDDARPLARYEVKRVLRQANRWRLDTVQVTDPAFVLPRDYDQALNAWRANTNRFQFVPEVICDGRAIHRYEWEGKVAVNGRPIKNFLLTDDSQADSLSPTLLFPERACRPIFRTGPFDHLYEVQTEKEGLVRVKVVRTATAKKWPVEADTYWLDPDFGSVAVRMAVHSAAARNSNAGLIKPREIALRDFKESPRGFWYPTVVSRDLQRNAKQVTRLYVDFADVPSDEMFRTINPAP
jgi:hypothetical protein